MKEAHCASEWTNRIVNNECRVLLQNRFRRQNLFLARVHAKNMGRDCPINLRAEQKVNQHASKKEPMMPLRRANLCI